MHLLTVPYMKRHHFDEEQAVHDNGLLHIHFATHICNEPDTYRSLQHMHMAVPLLRAAPHFPTAETELSLLLLLLLPVSAGRCFYHVIVRQVRELQGSPTQARCLAALPHTLTALADRLTATLAAAAAATHQHHLQQQQQQLCDPAASAGAAPGGLSSMLGFGNGVGHLLDGDSAGFPQQATKRPRLEDEAYYSSAATAAAAAASDGSRVGSAGVAVPLGSDITNGGLLPRWPQEVVHLLQQQYIYHLPGATDADRALLSSTVLQLFGFHMQDQHAS
jgi:hypothetical protein